MCETGTGQKVAQLLDSYMMMKKLVIQQWFGYSIYHT
jgi:hypothetical protein